MSLGVFYVPTPGFATETEVTLIGNMVKRYIHERLEDYVSVWF